MNILAIDTSTNVCSVCILSDDRVVAEYTSISEQTHTERLLPAIDLLFHHSSFEPADLNLLSVIHGPGSFTGLRIGLSVTKGLAFALKLPVIAASALEIAALQAPEDGWICPCMDARRDQIFTALFERRGDHVKMVKDPVSINPQEWRRSLPDAPIFFCGPGAALYWKELQNHEASTIVFRDFFLAKTLAQTSRGQFEMGKTIDGKDLRAAYLRPTDAEEKGPRILKFPSRANKKK